MIYKREVLLTDTYPVYPGYWYLADGVPIMCELQEVSTVENLKKATGAKEIRCCDLIVRNLPIM